MNKQTSIALIIIVLALAIVGIMALQKKSIPATNQNTNTSQNMGSMGMMVDNNSIAVGAQGENNMLTASMLVITDPGFVVVHEDNNGQPGKVIGVSRLVGPGMVHNVGITLSRTAVKGEKLYVMLHKDNGDKTYTDVDSPIVGKTGDPIMMVVTVEAGTPTAPGAMSM